MKSLLALALVACLTSAALADTPLRVARSDQRMRVDGSLREWRGARFVSPDGSGFLQYALAHRDGGLYLAARVDDDRVVRGNSPGPGQDALVLTFAMPDREGGWVGTEVWLHPGVPGQMAAAAGTGRPGKRPRPASQIAVVEGPAEQGKGGYVLEAFIPWDALREAELWQMGRAALRYEDASRRGKAQARLHTAQGRRLGELPPLLSGQGEVDALADFLKSRGLAGAQPSFDLKGNVFGDRGAERVTLVKGFVVLSGPSVGGGSSFSFTRLPLGGGAVTDAELRDVTGDGREELLVRMRQKNAQGERHVWGVVQLSGGSPQLAFGVELEKRWPGGAIESSLRLAPTPGSPVPSIVVERGRAQNTDASQFRETPARDAQPILLPWEPVRRRIYRYGAGEFRLVDEQRDPSPAAAATGSSEGSAAAAGEKADAPVPPGQGEILAAVKKALGLPASARPDRTLRANLAGDGRPETVYGFGSRLVLVGPGIGDGQGYLVYGVPLRDGDALLSVRTADVTGDDLAEILVRVRQALAEDVQREVLLVQRLRGEGVERVLAVEVARTRQGKRIENQVVVKGGALRIEAGRAQGWGAGNYPFPDEAVGGVGRLLLPWKDRRPVRYRLVQGKLQP